MAQIISSSTTWAAGTTVTLTSDIQIAAGATLTIDPGVIVQGNGHTIQTFGTLDAAGSAGAQIQLQNTVFTFSTNYLQPGTISIDHATLSGGSFLRDGDYGSWSLTNSTITGQAPIHVWYPTGNVLIQGDYFYNTGGVSIGTNGTVTVTVDDNTFSGWTSNVWSNAAVENWASYSSSQTVVNNNNFLDTGKIALELVPGYSSAAMTATGNYFGTTDASAIANMIYDQHVDLNSAGIIPNSDVQSSFVAGAPLTPACFAEGTSVLTEHGLVPVESLQVGTQVVTREGGMEPIIWLGRRHTNCATHPHPHHVWPVRIAAHAFGPDQPFRDLYLSPDHSIFADDILVPIRCLLNGTTITQLEVPSVSYYHVELASHQVLLANGLDAESYLDTNSRREFDNGDGPTILHPDFWHLRWEGEGYAPLVVHGEKLDRVRHKLSKRASELSAVGRHAA